MNDAIGQIIKYYAAIILIVCAVCVTWHLIRSWHTRKRKFPPGLPSIPILGSLPWLTGDVTHLTFDRLAKKYGKIFTIDFGRQHAVFLNDYSSIKEALIDQAVPFADRPAFHTTQETNPDRKGIFIAPYDKTYIHNKQVWLAIMRDLGFGRRAMEQRILTEVKDLLDAFVAQEGRPFDPGDQLYFSVSNIVCLFLFNKRFSLNDSRFLDMLKALQTLNKQFGELMMVEFLPLVCYLPWARRLIQSNTNILHDFTNFMDKELKGLPQARVAHGHESNFISAYKERMAERLDPEVPSHIMVEFFAAGTDTTSTTLRWALIYLANNPDIQSRAQRSIDDVIGQAREPAISDRISMGYVEAVILETLRKSSIVALAFPHMLLTDTELRGFHLEKGTVVYANLWSAQNDPDEWPKPEMFDPGRFLDGEDKIINREKVIAFSVGRRSCLGEALARQELFLYLTSILQRFDVLPPPGQSRISEDTVFGTVVGPKPHLLVLRPR